MKLLLASALAISLGLGWFAPTSVNETAASTTAAGIDEACPIADCDMTVECRPDGTCYVECEGQDGESCWAELECTPDGDCIVLDSSCDGIEDCIPWGACDPCEPAKEPAARAGCCPADESTACR